MSRSFEHTENCSCSACISQGTYKAKLQVKHNWKVIKSKYTNRCNKCLKDIKIQDSIYWNTQSKLVRCSSCIPDEVILLKLEQLNALKAKGKSLSNASVEPLPASSYKKYGSVIPSRGTRLTTKH